jgi:hypothetical protein
MFSTSARRRAGERQREDDRAVAHAHRRLRDHGEQLADVIGGEAARPGHLDARAFERVAGVGRDDVHADQEAVEAAEAGEARTDRDG